MNLSVTVILYDLRNIIATECACSYVVTLHLIVIDIAVFTDRNECPFFVCNTNIIVSWCVGGSKATASAGCDTVM